MKHVVVGRASTFADPDVIAMATDDFVPVCTDDWYTRRRKDAEGDFFRAMASAAGRTGEGGATRQGIYCFTADGTVLGSKNAGQDAAVMKQVFKDALAKFKKLPAEKRKPGGVAVPELGKADPNYTRTPPAGGLVVRVNTRTLDRKRGEYCTATCGTTGGDQSARDFLWLTAAEVKGLLPPKGEAGKTYPLPEAVARRIARFHLLDNTRGEPPFWKADEVRTSEWALTVVGVTDAAYELRLDGRVLLSTSADAEKADRGYEGRVGGTLRYDRAAERFTGVEVAAVGQHWGESAYTKGARPGKTTLGFAFTLADPAKPGEGIPPQGTKDEAAYWGRD